MVKTTTQAKASAPGPAVIMAIDWKWTSATVSVITNTSSMDQRPIFSIRRYKRVRCCGRQREPRCVVQASRLSVASFSSGTRMLAIKTMQASGHSPLVQKNTIPLMMVSSCEPKIELVCRIGSKLAGIYNNAAAISSAHVRDTLSGMRECKLARHRGQRGAGARAVGDAADPQPFGETVGALTRPQIWQASRPSLRAVRCFNMVSSRDLVAASARPACCLAPHNVIEPAEAGAGLGLLQGAHRTYATNHAGRTRSPRRAVSSARRMQTARHRESPGPRPIISPRPPRSRA